MSYLCDLSGFDISKMTNVSYYWLGFLLADGNFRFTPSGVPMLTVELSEKDLSHLQNLLVFLGRDASTYLTRHRQTAICSRAQTHVSFSLTSPDLLKLMTYFNIVPNKTVNPPNLDNYYSLTDTQKYSLLVGYIDGDGYVRGRKGHRDGKLECHASWRPVYDFFSSFLVDSKLTESVRPDKNNRSSIILYLSSESIKQLYWHAVANNLPILCRKWESVKTSLDFKPDYSKCGRPIRSM